MAKGLPGADSSAPVIPAGIAAATALFGRPPAFWGRYFTSPTTPGTVEYRGAAESPVLAAAGIRLLPVARQTRRVGGTRAQGAADGALNAADYVETFGADRLAAQGGQFLVFLDVEGTPASGSPSLSAAYWAGWAEGLAAEGRARSAGRVTLLPAAYAPVRDTATWQAISAAAAAGSPCAGAWVARYRFPGCAMTDWDPAVVTPSVALPCPVLAWQYQEGCCQGAIDCSQTNPGVDADALLLSRLVLPG